MKEFISQEKVKKAIEEIGSKSILFSEKINLSDLIDEISQKYDMYQGISYNKLLKALKDEFARLNYKDILEFKERIREYPPETKKALILFYENN